MLATVLFSPNTSVQPEVVNRKSSLKCQCLYLKTNQEASFFLKKSWDLLHARLNSNYKGWSYKNKKHKKIKEYRKSVQEKPTVKRYLLILDLKLFRSQVKGKYSIGSFKIFTGILFGPDDLWESSEDIINDISFLPVGVKTIFVFVLDRQSV